MHYRNSNGGIWARIEKQTRRRLGQHQIIKISRIPFFFSRKQGRDGRGEDQTG